MSFKPADFFLGVVNFLGDLVPGGILVFILLFNRDSRIWSEFTAWHSAQWFAFGVAAYTVGQLLLAVSEFFNGTVDRVSSWLNPCFYRKLVEAEASFRAFSKLGFPPPDSECTMQGRASCFHSALAWVRLRNSSAAAEIDHGMADYKLLRCLLVILPISMWVSRPHLCWIFAEFVGWICTYIAFLRMYNWARYFAFDYALQIERLPGKVSPSASGLPAEGGRQDEA